MSAVMFIVEAEGTRLRAFASRDDADAYARECVSFGYDLVMTYPVEEDEDLFYSLNSRA